MVPGEYFPERFHSNTLMVAMRIELDLDLEKCDHMVLSKHPGIDGNLIEIS